MTRATEIGSMGRDHGTKAAEEFLGTDPSRSEIVGLTGPAGRHFWAERSSEAAGPALQLDAHDRIAYERAFEEAAIQRCLQALDAGVQALGPKP